MVANPAKACVAKLVPVARGVGALRELRWRGLPGAGLESALVLHRLLKDEGVAVILGQSDFAQSTFARNAARTRLGRVVAQRVVNPFLPLCQDFKLAGAGAMKGDVGVAAEQVGVGGARWPLRPCFGQHRLADRLLGGMH